MAKNTPKKTMTQFEKTLTTVIVVVILAVLALAVFATYGRISENMEQAAISSEADAIANGEQEATVRYMASNSGMSVEDYLAQYGLELGGELSETSSLSDMVDKMTLENYFKYSDDNSGETTDIDAELTEWGADEYGITKDTTWGETQEKLPLIKYLGEEDFNNLIEQYSAFGYDASGLTPEMTIKEANDKVEEMLEAGPVNTIAPVEVDETVDEDAAAETPAE